MLRLRKIVFYIFALIYLILCPLLVARMLGFVINPLTHRLVKTGLVYVATNPPEAFVYIDGRLAHQKTPAVIRDLTPGQHFIRIELRAYNDWERYIPIVGRKATVLANILLIPQTWPIKVISNQPYQNIFIADEDILIATNPLLKNIDIFHTTQGIGEDFRGSNTDEKNLLFTKNSVYAAGYLVRLFTEPKSQFVLLEANIKDKHKFLWINLKENPPIIKDISDLFAKIPRRISWSNDDNENIFAFYPPSSGEDSLRPPSLAEPEKVYRINIKDKSTYPLSIGSLNQPTTDTQQNEFLINDKNDLLMREGKWIRIYSKEAFGAPQVYDIAKSRPATNMYFEEKNGELFYLDDDTGALFAAQILPYHPILNIPIPEALRMDSRFPAYIKISGGQARE